MIKKKSSKWIDNLQKYSETKSKSCRFSPGTLRFNIHESVTPITSVHRECSPTYADSIRQSNSRCVFYHKTRSASCKYFM